MPPLNLGERIAAALAGRYSVDRELGRGGMATVYLGHDLKHDRPVAIKVLRAGLGSLFGPERFQREIRLAAQLQHPNILPVYDSGATDGVLWYTMPYVEGDTLRGRLRRRGRFSVTEAVPVLQDLARADASLAERLDPALPVIGAQVVWAARTEMARSVEDVLARRCRALFLDAAAAVRMAPAVASVMARELGRDEEWQRGQVAAFTTLARQYMVR